MREKVHREFQVLPYRITDTGGLVENTKAIGRRMFKELGKKAGRNLWEMPCPVIIDRAKQKIIWQLFI